MKKNLFLIIALFSLAISFGQTKPKTPPIKSSTAKTFSQPIPDHNWVDTCIQNYKNVYKKCTDLTFKKTQTESIAYNLNALKTWIDDLKTNTDCDTIKVEIGLYKGYFKGAKPDDVLKIKQNRITTFLVPYNSNKKAIYTKRSNKAPGDEADPFDLGDLQP